MTIEEAIVIIETAKAEIEWNYPLEYAQAFEMAIAALRAQAETEQKEPLTLEELRRMDGELVRIERIGERTPYDSETAVVHTENRLCRTSDGCKAYFELYGISWLAYRHKPMEITHE